MTTNPKMGMMSALLHTALESAHRSYNHLPLTPNLEPEGSDSEEPRLTLRWLKYSATTDQSDKGGGLRKIASMHRARIRVAGEARA